MNTIRSDRSFFSIGYFIMILMCAVFFLWKPVCLLAGTGAPVLDGGIVKLNLSISFRYNEADPDSWISMFQAANELLWNATECQVQIGQIDVYVQQNEDKADILIDTGLGAASATVNGYDDSAPHGHLYLTNIHKIIDESAHDARGYFGLNHELGHYVFGLYDEYQAILLDGPGGTVLDWDYRVGTDCVDSTSWVASIMDGGTTVHPSHHRHEYCTNPDDGAWNTAHHSPPWWDASGYVVLEQSYYHDDKSCWEVLVETMADRWGFALTQPSLEPDNEVCTGLDDIIWRVYSQIYKQVICLDRSDSMSWYGGERLYLAKTGASLYVNLVEPMDELAVTSYATTAGTNFSLTEVTSANEFTVKGDANDEISFISASGATAIGEGLSVSLEEIETTEKAGVEAIILLSDGYHNTGIDPNDVIPDLIARGVVVYAIGVGDEVDEETLSSIASATGGQYFYADDVTDLLSPIYGTLSSLVHGESELAEEEGTAEPEKTSSMLIQVDEYAQRVTFILHCRYAELSFELKDPDGITVTSSSASGDPDIDFVSSEGYAFYRIVDPKPGKWTTIVNLKETDKIERPYTLQVLSHAPTVEVSMGTDHHIYDQGQIMLIKAKVAAFRPIKGAEVHCYVTFPNREQLIFLLSDDGKHGDNQADDGCYGNYFNPKQYDGGPGSYQFKVVAQVEHGQYVTIGGFSTYEESAEPYPPIHRFQRIVKGTAVVRPADQPKIITGHIEEKVFIQDNMCLLKVKTETGETYEVYLYGDDCDKVEYCCTITVKGIETDPGIMTNASLVDVISCGGEEIKLTGHVEAEYPQQDGSCIILLRMPTGASYNAHLSGELCAKVNPCCTIEVTGIETNPGFIEVTTINIISCEVTITGHITKKTTNKDGSCVLTIKANTGTYYKVHLSKGDCTKVRVCCTVKVSGTEADSGVLTNALLDKVISCKSTGGGTSVKPGSPSITWPGSFNFGTIGGMGFAGFLGTRPGFTSPLSLGTGFSPTGLGGFGFSPTGLGGFGFSTPGLGGFGFSTPSIGGFGFSTPSLGGFGFPATGLGGFGGFSLGGFGTGFNLPFGTGTGLFPSIGNTQFQLPWP